MKIKPLSALFTVKPNTNDTYYLVVTSVANGSEVHCSGSEVHCSGSEVHCSGSEGHYIMFATGVTTIFFTVKI